LFLPLLQKSRKRWNTSVKSFPTHTDFLVVFSRWSRSCVFFAFYSSQLWCCHLSCVFLFLLTMLLLRLPLISLFVLVST
jgi:hypothetical protein